LSLAPTKSVLGDVVIFVQAFGLKRAFN